jgi:hypothetical protein
LPVQPVITTPGTVGTNAPGTQSPTTPTGPNYGDTSQITDQSLQIINFTIVATTGGYYQISGDVVAQSPGGLVVTFSGPASVQGVTTTTDANGHFEVTVAISGGGMVTAQCGTAQASDYPPQ